MTVNYATGERPSHAEVRESIEITKSHLERAAEQVVWQIESQAWLSLGYKSWDEMREAEYRGAAVIVPPADRPELSSRLRAAGMSHRAIADTLGVGETTVRRDNRQMADTPATRTDSLGRERPTSYTPKTPASSSGGEATFDAGQASTPVLPATKGQGVDQRETDVEDAPMVGASMTQSGEGPGDASADDGAATDNSVSSRSALTDYIEGSQAVQDARYLSNFYSAITKAGDYRLFDAERIGRIGDEHDMRTLELQARSATEFYEKAKQARSGLRIITGGKA